MEEETQLQNQEQTNPIAKLLARKRLLIFSAAALLIAFLVIGLLLFVFTRQQQPPAASTENSIPPKVLPAISLDPSVITVEKGQSEYSANVMVNSQDIEAEGVVIEVQYDPTSITDVQIVPSSDADLNIGGAIKVESSFSNPEFGKAAIAIRKDPSQNLSPKKISGRVAVIYFKVNSNANLPSSVTLATASEFMTANATPTNPTLTNLNIEPPLAVSTDAEKRIEQQLELIEGK